MSMQGWSLRRTDKHRQFDEREVLSLQQWPPIDARRGEKRRDETSRLISLSKSQAWPSYVENSKKYTGIENRNWNHNPYPYSTLTSRSRMTLFFSLRFLIARKMSANQISFLSFAYMYVWTIATSIVLFALLRWSDQPILFLSFPAHIVHVYVRPIYNMEGRWTEISQPNFFPFLHIYVQRLSIYISHREPTPSIELNDRIGWKHVSFKEIAGALFGGLPEFGASCRRYFRTERIFCECHKREKDEYLKNNTRFSWSRIGSGR